MTTMRPPVVGIFNNSSMAERAIEELREVGFSNQEISYSGRSSKGGFFDNLKSWMAGEEPPAGEEIARGLSNMGIPTDAANYYAHEYEAGHPIVAVQSPGHEQEVATVFRNNGGQSYSGATSKTTGTTTAPSSSTYTRTQGATGQGTTAAGTSSTEGTRERTTRGRDRDMEREGRTVEQGQVNMPLREEQLRAEKRPVQTGEVNIRKDIVTEQKSIDVPVSREEVVIERRPVTDAQPSDTPIGQEGTETTRIPVREEQVRISKDTVQTGEVSIGKRTTEEQKRFSDTVQREEAEIERTGDVTIHDEDEDENMRRRRR